MSSHPAYRLLVKSAKQLVQVTSQREPFVTSGHQNRVAVLQRADDNSTANGGYSLVVNKLVHGGKRIG